MKGAETNRDARRANFAFGLELLGMEEDWPWRLADFEFDYVSEYFTYE